MTRHETLSAPLVSAPKFAWPVRVYYEDTDAGGIVYYANYLRFMERARSEWLRTLGIDHGELRSEHTVMLVVVRTDVQYRRPAVLDDALEVTVALQRARRASLDLHQLVTRNATEILCEASVRIACIDSTRHQPRPFPSAVFGAMR
jgi:acyl-CoA thioester hydrolase